MRRLKGEEGMSKPGKQYLGDAVYAEWDGYYIKLTTENGIEATNTIFLEPSVLESFDEYKDSVVRFIAQQRSLPD